MLKLVTALIERAKGTLRPTSHRDQLGNRGEATAARYLKRKKFKVLARNVRVSFGEADLLCLAPDRETIVVVEVKTRRVEAGETRPYFAPEASITREKRRKLRAVMMHLARANRWTDRPLRVDAIGVEWPVHGEPLIRHHEGVIRAGRKPTVHASGRGGAGA